LSRVLRRRGLRCLRLRGDTDLMRTWI
jgi:hypothetical protein